MVVAASFPNNTNELHIMDWLARLRQALRSRYVRMLESEIARERSEIDRLRQEIRALLNSLLGTAGCRRSRRRRRIRRRLRRYDGVAGRRSRRRAKSKRRGSARRIANAIARDPPRNS